ncbi:MAG TPA: amidophosphoribosyltransferase [Candidatus Brocadiia bacterium]|nr:amidophosphoribosyltransferase [Candidatus Brocadiia bacterium]
MDAKEKCGIAAVAQLDNAEPCLFDNGRAENAAALVPRILLDLQHRGELSAGITTYDPNRATLLKTYADIGAVSQVFQLFHPTRGPALAEEYAGVSGIGHTRYATCGEDDRSYAQPFERPHGRPWKWFSIAFNGNLANFATLRKRITQHGYHLVRNADTEAMLHFFAHAMRGLRRPAIPAVFAGAAKEFDGAYNIAFINAQGEVAVARDPLGFRPLCYAVSGNMFVAASESVALSNLGLHDIRSVEPGTVVYVSDGKLHTRRYADSPRFARCFFEWVYFANAASVIDGRSVYLARANLGRELARMETVTVDKDTLVVPVPDCAKAAADAMAYHLGAPSVEGLLRNRYVGRTFIQGAGRMEKARRKYAPLPEVIRGKRIILVEDSIVRLTTLRLVVRQMRDFGAREIHVRSTAPPILAPCFYGIDMSTIGELYAPKFLAEPCEDELPPEVSSAMAADMGADSLRYLPVNRVAKCVGFPESELCLACLNRQYPTPAGCAQYEAAVKNWKQGIAGRTYESDAPPAEPQPAPEPAPTVG